MKLFKDKKKLSDKEQIKRLKRANLRLQIEMLIIAAMFFGILLFNYNYTVFKVLIACGYTDTNTLDTVFTDSLNTDVRGQYLSNFDNAVIEVFTERIREENNDQYTLLFKQGELRQELDIMEEDGAKTTFEMADDTTGLMTITTFSKSQYNNFAHLKEKIASCNNLIIDLRGNPGGMVKYADRTAEAFLPKGSIIAEYRYRSKLLSKVVTSDNTTPMTFEHIYILQDENTASAAEIFINALRENLDNVTLVGETTYGKGVGQVEMRLLDGYGFKATAIDILSPKGNSINHVGIEADIQVELETALDLDPDLDLDLDLEAILP